jgi:hypothetical protein
VQSVSIGRWHEACKAISSQAAILETKPHSWQIQRRLKPDQPLLPIRWCLIKIGSEEKGANCIFVLILVEKGWLERKKTGSLTTICRELESYS